MNPRHSEELSLRGVSLALFCGGSKKRQNKDEKWEQNYEWFFFQKALDQMKPDIACINMISWYKHSIFLIFHKISMVIVCKLINSHKHYIKHSQQIAGKQPPLTLVMHIGIETEKGT